MVEDVEKRIKQLREQVKHHSDLYHRGKEEISDYDYDRLVEDLRDLERKHPEYASKSSPTQCVASDLSGAFPVCRHRYPMLSLDNTYTLEDLRKYDEQVQKGLNTRAYEYVCELKFDGVAISLVYENGVFRRAVSRGDGTRGEEITQNVREIEGIPRALDNGLDVGDYAEVRGEIFMKKGDFEALNEKRKAQGAVPYANPRNVAAGTLKLKKAATTQSRPLSCFAYGVQCGSKKINTQMKAMAWLASEGFHLSGHHRLCRNMEAVKSYIDEWQERRAALSVEIDGIVLSINNRAQQAQLGRTAKSPRWAMAYKYAPQRAFTRLKGVLFQVGRTGAVTPVALLEPVHLDGSMVSRASLYNKKAMEALSLYEGARVQVEKAGDIIPRVVSSQKTKDSHKGLVFATHCPCCGSVLEERQSIHYCVDASCSDQIKGRIEHFAQRDALDIAELGKENIDVLVLRGLIKDAGDLYALRWPDFGNLKYNPMFNPSGHPSVPWQEKSVKNILNSIERSKSRDFNHVLFGLGIGHVGKTMAEKLARPLQKHRRLCGRPPMMRSWPWTAWEKRPPTKFSLFSQRRATKCSWISSKSTIYAYLWWIRLRFRAK